MSDYIKCLGCGYVGAFKKPYNKWGEFICSSCGETMHMLEGDYSNIQIQLLIDIRQLLQEILDKE